LFANWLTGRVLVTKGPYRRKLKLLI